MMPTTPESVLDLTDEWVTFQRVTTDRGTVLVQKNADNCTRSVLVPTSRRPAPLRFA